jgi:hypothetical protein
MRTLRALLALASIVGFAALAQSGNQSVQQSASNREAELGTGGAGDGGMMMHHGKHMGDGGMMHHGKHIGDGGMMRHHGGRHMADAGM